MRKIVNYICILIPIVAFVIILGDVNTQVPIHFDANSAPDNYGTKYTYLLFIGIPVILLYGSSILEKKSILSANNIKQSKRLITYILMFFAFISVFVMQSAASGSFLHASYLIFSFGALFAVIGNSMNKLERNKYIGIRIPATLSSDQVWNKTHRRSGWIFAIYGILLMIVSPFVTNPKILLIGFIIDLCIIITYITYYSRKVKKEVEGR